MKVFYLRAQPRQFEMYFHPPRKHSRTLRGKTIYESMGAMSKIT